MKTIYCNIVDDGDLNITEATTIEVGDALRTDFNATTEENRCRFCDLAGERRSFVTHCGWGSNGVYRQAYFPIFQILNAI